MASRTNIRELKLWPHQSRAIEMVRRYLKAWGALKKPGSALVRFPTGTGKTAVIAIAARVLAGPGVVVVVCPAEPLREQLCEEIRERLWLKLGVEPLGRDVVVQTFLPSNVEGHLAHAARCERLVLVGTAQALAEIRRKRPTAFEQLRKRASLLLFDEGHREPARRWGEAARALKCPSILFTATPYRNDYALFAILPEFVESLSFHEALAGRCIRDVEVIERRLDRPDDLVRQLRNLLQRASPETRAIVRCATRNSIVEVVSALTSAGLSAIGIHDRFGSVDGSGFRRDVPKPDAEPARIWVHQHKLLEGIDDPRFGVVAIYEGFANARSLVQQVGRVIRNPTREESVRAMLLLDRKQGQREYWTRYLDFETEFDPTRHDVRDLIQSAVASQPAFRYLDGGFRRKFDPYSSGFHEWLRFPRAANIYHAPAEWSPSILCREIVAEWEQGERVILNYAVLRSDTVVVLYAEAQNSPVLLRDYYIEDRLGVTVIHRNGNWIFYHDTGGVLCEALRNSCSELDPQRMYALFGKDARAVSMSMRNTDLGRHALRRRSVHAYSLHETALGLSDHGYFCSTVQGYANVDRVNVARYVGVARCRVRESCPPNHGLDAFLEWASTKAEHLRSSDGNGINAVFGRFARPTQTPPDTTPTHLLLDVAELIERRAYRTASDLKDLSFDDLALPVTDGFCNLVANGNSYRLGVSYTKGRYLLHAPEMEAAYVLEDPSDRFRRGIIAHANVEQSFRIVPAGGWTIYAHGHFVAPCIQVGTKGEGPDITQLITRVAGTRPVDRVTAEQAITQ